MHKDFVQAVYPVSVCSRTNKYKLTASGRPKGSKDVVCIYRDDMILSLNADLMTFFSVI